MNKPLLIVDDDSIFTEVLARRLQRLGFDCITAADHAQALALSCQHQPEYALVDLNLAGDSGLALIPALKQQQPELRIVMLTGYSSIATAVEAVKLGAMNYLCKPASSEEILAAFEHTEMTTTAVIPDEPPSVERLEWEHIQKIMQDNDGNISATARALGMHRRTLQRKLQKRPVRR